MKNETSIQRFERYKKIIIDIIDEILPHCKIYLFGSRARLNHDEGADIDIALDMGKPINNKKITSIREKFEESTMPLMVDVVDYRIATEDFRKEIDKDKVV